jgi:hypothetical protein
MGTSEATHGCRTLCGVTTSWSSFEGGAALDWLRGLGCYLESEQWVPEARSCLFPQLSVWSMQMEMHIRGLA